MPHQCSWVIPLFLCSCLGKTSLHKGEMMTLKRSHFCTWVVPLSVYLTPHYIKGEIMTLIVPELSLFVRVVLFRKHHSWTDVDRYRLTELQVGNIGPPVGQLQRYICWVCKGCTMSVKLLKLNFSTPEWYFFFTWFEYL